MADAMETVQNAPAKKHKKRTVITSAFAISSIFLNPLLPKMIKELMMEQKNFCAECGCSCVCNADCGGDTRMCTSKGALERLCKHRCECYIDPLVKRWEEEGIIKRRTKIH